jgi:hypothetical protein
MQTEVAGRVPKPSVDELQENIALSAIDDFIDELGLSDKQVRSLRSNGS